MGGGLKQLNRTPCRCTKPAFVLPVCCYSSVILLCCVLSCVLLFQAALAGKQVIAAATIRHLHCVFNTSDWSKDACVIRSTYSDKATWLSKQHDQNLQLSVQCVLWLLFLILTVGFGEELLNIIVYVNNFLFQASLSIFSSENQNHSIIFQNINVHEKNIMWVN